MSTKVAPSGRETLTQCGVSDAKCRLQNFHRNACLLLELLAESVCLDDMSSSESGGVGSALIPRFERGVTSSDGRVDGGVWGSRRAIGYAGGGCCVGDGGEATTMSAAPESQARGVGSSSRQPLNRISATVQLMFKLGGVPMGSANAADSRRHARAGSSPSAPLISKAGGNEKDRRNDSMLCKTRLATELRGRGGSRCTRRGLVCGP